MKKCSICKNEYRFILGTICNQCKSTIKILQENGIERHEAKKMVKCGRDYNGKIKYWNKRYALSLKCVG